MNQRLCKRVEAYRKAHRDKRRQVSEGIAVRVIYDDVLIARGEPPRALWVAVTDDPEEAVSIVRARVTPYCRTETDGIKVSAETV